MGIAGALALGWLLFLPVPLSWAINLGFRWFIPLDPRVQLRVDSATFRWRAGRDTAQVDLSGVAAFVRGRPLASFAHATVEMDKAAARHGRYAPRLVVISGARAVIDATPQGAVHALAASPTASLPPTASQRTLLAFAPVLPEAGAQSRVTIRGFAIDYVLPTLAWQLDAGVEATLTHDRSGDVTLDGAFALGATGQEPVHATLRALMGLKSERVDVSLDVPEFRLSRMPTLPGVASTLTGTVATSLTGSLDYATGNLLGGSVDFALRDAHFPVVPGGPSVTLERIDLRGRLERRGDTLTGSLERGEVVLEGARLLLRRLSASFGAHSRLEWESELSDFSGARIQPHLPPALLAREPWLARVFREFAIANVNSRGRATLERDPRGAWAIRELSVQQQMRASLAGEPLHLEIGAAKAENLPISATVRLAPFEVRRVARAFPGEWRLSLGALPVELEGSARLAPSGLLLDARAVLTAGRGEVRPWRTGQPAVTVQRARADVRVSEGGVRLEVADGQVECSLGSFQARDVGLRWEAGTTRLAGKVEVRRSPAAEVVPVLFPSFLPLLRGAGMSPADLVLESSTATFAIEGRKDAARGWQLLEGDGQADIAVVFMGKTLGAHTSVQLPRGETEFIARTVWREWVPAELGPRKIFGLDLADLRFPVRGESSGRMSVETGAWRAWRARVQAGPGAVQVPAWKAAVPFRTAEADVEIDPTFENLRVAKARVELVPGVAGELEQAAIHLASGHATGVARFGPGSLADTLKAWPLELFPAWRRVIAAAGLAGRLEARGIEFAFEPIPGGGLRLARAAGRLAGERLAGHVPGVPDRVEIGRAIVDLDFPGVEIRIMDTRVPGGGLPAVRFATANLLAARPEAELEATLHGDPEGMRAWLRGMTVPEKLSAALRQSRPVQGELKARLAGAWPDFSGTDVQFTLHGEKVSVPDLLEGPIDLRVVFNVPTRTTAGLAATFTLGDVTWAGPTRPAGFSPIAMSVQARDWQTPERSVVDVTTTADAFFGLPLRLSGTLKLSGDRTVVERATLREARVGRTELHGEWRATPGGGAVTVQAKQIDVGEMVRAGAPWLEVVPRPAASAAKPLLVLPAATVPGEIESPPRVEFDVTAMDVDFGAGRRLQDVAVTGTIIGGWPERLRVTANEGVANPVRVELAPAPSASRQRLRVSVSDTAALSQTLTEPLRAVKLPPGKLADSVTSAGRIPQLLAGGEMTVEGEVWHRPEGVTGQGGLRLENATMIQPPRILKLLSLRSGKSLERSPLIRKLAVHEWAFDPSGATVKGFGLEGTGLIDRLKLKSVSYRFEGGKLAMDGDYFGVGFEVIGTRADPQVFLKETPLLKALILQPDSGFFTDEPASPKKK